MHTMTLKCHATCIKTNTLPFTPSVLVPTTWIVQISIQNQVIVSIKKEDFNINDLEFINVLVIIDSAGTRLTVTFTTFFISISYF